jgi:YD repeat-containing protein
MDISFQLIHFLIMKKQFILPYCLMCIVALVLVNCRDNNEPNPDPGRDNTPAPTIASVTPSAGTVGTKVVIIGTNFSATAAENKIKFGLVEVSADSATSTRLVTKIPKDAVTGKISVQVKSQSVTFSSDFTITQETAVFVNSGSGATATTDVTATSARVSSTIEKEGSKTIIQHGHVWSSVNKEPFTNGRATAKEGKSELGSLPATATFPYQFKSDVKDLDASTIYYVRAYVTTSEGTTYGAVSQVESGKPCLLASVGYTAFSYNAKNQIVKIGNDNNFTYNSDGFLTRYEFISFNPAVLSYVTETYAYEQGRLAKKESKRSLSANSTITTYTYDSDGRLSKETQVTGSATREATYVGGILNKVTLSNGTLVTVENGRIVKQDNGNNNYSMFQYDANGNQTKVNYYVNGKLTDWFEYKYDDQPNFEWAVFSFKGWSADQLIAGGFTQMALKRSRNNCTETSYLVSGNSRTQIREFSYGAGAKVKGYKDTTKSSTMADQVSNITFTYNGACD